MRNIKYEEINDDKTYKSVTLLFILTRFLRMIRPVKIFQNGVVDEVNTSR
jgi:hypothetical protein